MLLLLSTTTYRAQAFLEAAAQLGVEAVVGSEKEQVLAPANPAGNLLLDFREPEEAARRIAEYSTGHPLAAVIAADDEGALAAALAAERLGLEHHSARGVAAARDKHRMREGLAASGMPQPGFRKIPLDDDPAAVASGLRYPCVIKPLSLSASRGVIRADDEAGFLQAFRRIADLVQTLGSDEALLVEDYLPGQEVALEGIVTRGALRALAIFDKPDPLEGPFFEETIYVTPSRLPVATQETVARRTQEAVRALGLVHGPVHAELRVHQGQATLVEIAPRSIGGLCSRALRFDGGVSLEQLILGHALGRDVRALEREAQAAGVMMIPIPRRGTLRRVDGIPEARAVQGIDEVRITIPIGQEVVPLPEGARYLGFLFARAPDPAQVESALRAAQSRLRFTIESPDFLGPRRRE